MGAGHGHFSSLTVPDPNPSLLEIVRRRRRRRSRFCSGGKGEMKRSTDFRLIVYLLIAAVIGFNVMAGSFIAAGGVR